MQLKYNDIRYILSETTKRLLNEISIRDAYVRFYSDIPQNVYNLIVGKLNKGTLEYNDTTALQPDTKWGLTLYRKFGENVLEDIYKLRNPSGDGYLDIFDRLKIRKMINGPSADLNHYKSIAELGKFVNSFDFNEVMGRTKGEMSNAVNAAANDIEIPYEDEQWKIVIPKSYEASCYWGKDTEWCTATRETDEHYNRYTKTGPLFININKTNGKKYQFHFQSKQFMDAEDMEIDYPVFGEMGASEGMIQYYKNIIPKEELMNMNYYPLAAGERWEIKDKRGLYNIIDENEQLISDIWFDAVNDYYGGLAKVKKEGKFNYITMDGRLISKRWFDSGSAFSRGWAGVSILSKGRHIWNTLKEDGSLGCDFMWFDVIHSMNYTMAKCEKEGILLDLFLDGGLVGGNKDYRVKINSYEEFKDYRRNIFQEFNNKKEEWMQSLYTKLSAGNTDIIPHIKNNYSLDQLKQRLGIEEFYDIKDEDYK